MGGSGSSLDEEIGPAQELANIKAIINELAILIVFAIVIYACFEQDADMIQANLL